MAKNSELIFLSNYKTIRHTLGLLQQALLNKRQLNSAFNNHTARKLACMPRLRTTSPSLIYAVERLKSMRNKPPPNEIFRVLRTFRKDFAKLSSKEACRFAKIAADRQQKTLSTRYARRKALSGKDLYDAERAESTKVEEEGVTASWKDLDPAERLTFDQKAKSKNSELVIESMTAYLKARRRSVRKDFD